MPLGFLEPVLAEFRDQPFMVFQDRPVTYGELQQRRQRFREQLREQVQNIE